MSDPARRKHAFEHAASLRSQSVEVFLSSVRRLRAQGKSLADAVRFLRVRYPELSLRVMDQIGSWPSDEPALAMLQRTWAGRVAGRLAGVKPPEPPPEPPSFGDEFGEEGKFPAPLDMRPFMEVVANGWAQQLPVDSFGFYADELPSLPANAVYDQGVALRALRWMFDTAHRSVRGRGVRRYDVPDRYMREALEAAYEAKFSKREGRAGGRRG